MITTPPDGFNIDAFFQGITTFQKWELFPGYGTQGPKDVIAHMAKMHMPMRLDGLRILDIAPWNGFFGFECMRRGARELVSLGPDDPDLTGYNKTRELLEIGNCKYVRANVYDLSPIEHGTFDVVLFLGLIYHLRHPLLALDRIYDVCKHRLYVDSPIIDRIVFDKTISENRRKEILEKAKIIHDLPMLYFTKGNETGDSCNWFMPNTKAFCALVEASGFTLNTFADDGGGWASISATKGKRSFVPNLEGWNEAVVRKS